jgi:hypothetical protein
VKSYGKDADVNGKTITLKPYNKDAVSGKKIILKSYGKEDVNGKTITL